MKSLSCVRLLATPWTVSHEAPPSMGFSRQEYWSGGTIAFSNIHTFFFFFNCFWLCWVFSDAGGLSPVVASGGCSAAALRGLLSAVSSLVAERGLWGVRASVAAAPGPQSAGSAVSAPGASCPWLCGIFRTGIHPVSPVLAGGFLATELPRTPHPPFFFLC